MCVNVYVCVPVCVCGTEGHLEYCSWETPTLVFEAWPFVIALGSSIWLSWPVHPRVLPVCTSPTLGGACPHPRGASALLAEQYPYPSPYTANLYPLGPALAHLWALAELIFTIPVNTYWSSGFIFSITFFQRERLSPRRRNVPFFTLC